MRSDVPTNGVPAAGERPSYHGWRSHFSQLRGGEHRLADEDLRSRASRSALRAFGAELGA
jgi:hypothetical protein